MSDDAPNLAEEHFHEIDPGSLSLPVESDHPVNVLMLYGSLRERSFSRLMTEEAARDLRKFGAEVRIFDQSGLPLVDDGPDTHLKVQGCVNCPFGRRHRFGARQSVMGR